MAEKILIADDDADVCNLIHYTLENAGYEVMICTNGRNVIDKVREENPAALILDVMLPGLDGASIAKKMNEDPELKEIPIIIISSLETSKNLFQPILQVAKFISKPFNPDDLLEELQKALSGENGL
ncbi:MAG: response regulator [Elusimicrobiales bacterium]|nr:response regulator [Elusimicrobiales bacterium]